MQIKNYYIHKISDELHKRQKQNESYSLRAFARDLNLHPATLSQVIKNKRPLPLKFGLNVAELLCQNANERSLFLESLYLNKTSLDEIKISEDFTQYLLDESHAKVVAEWEHFTALELFDLEDFIFSPENVSHKLGISIERALTVMENLMTTKLITINQNGYHRTHQKIRTYEDIPNKALIDSHLETLEIGKAKLIEVDLELREYSSMTIAMDLSKLKEAKTIIREFKMKMNELLRDGKKTEVYQLAIQLYPLTKITKNNRRT